MMRRFASLLGAAVLLLTLCLPVQAAGKVTYSGDAGDFVFEPGSSHSLSDLFTDFKQVMPGDTRTQLVTLRNNASDKVQVKVFLRALGPHEPEVDAPFLSQLELTVRAGESNLFQAPADQTAQLSDWVCLGALESGGSVELEVTLRVPTSLDSRFMDQVGSLDWQFMVEEYDWAELVLPEQPEEPDEPGGPGGPGDPDEPDGPGGSGDPDEPDGPGGSGDPDEPGGSGEVVQPEQPEEPTGPDVPKTGDQVPVDFFTVLFIVSGLLLLVLAVYVITKKLRDRCNKSRM